MKWNPKALAGSTAFLVLVIVQASCSWFDPHAEIYGKWRAEQLSFGGLAIPVAPSLEFSPNKAVIDSQEVMVDSYEKRGNQITVHLRSAASLTFDMQGTDDMSLQVPVFGALKYRRIK